MRRWSSQYPLDRATEITGIPGEVIEEMAISYATAGMAQICWTLGITEHHNATDNVLALISLALLTGHVGRYGSGLVPLRGQNNVQGGGDMGAIPNKLPGFQDVENEAIRARVEGIWGRSIPPKRGWHLTQMFEAMDAGMLRGPLRHRGESGRLRSRREPRSQAPRRPRLHGRAGHLPHPYRPDGRCRVSLRRRLV